MKKNLLSEFGLNGGTNRSHFNKPTTCYVQETKT